MPRPNRPLLLALPFLLLVPLGALKWRLEWVAEHPPVSKLDQEFRAALNHTNSVFIRGEYPFWNRVTHLSDEEALLITDRKLLAQLGQAFRLSDEPWPEKGADRNNSRCIALWITNPPDHICLSFFYYRSMEGEGSYATRSDENGESTPFKVPPRFGPRFEALISQLAQRAQTRGQHPGLVLTSRAAIP